MGQSVHIHAWFPATYKATEDTWQQGKMMHSQPFGGPVVDEGLPNLVLQLCQLFTGLNETRLWQRFCSPSGTDYDFDQFLQINTPLKVNGNVTAILMLNKFANPVVAAVRAKTFRVLGLTGVILVVGLGLFGYSSARMLRPLKNLTIAAGEVAQGNLDITLPAPRSQDEVGRLSTTFNTMLGGLRQRDFIRDTFGRYLSKEVVEEVLDSPDGLKMGGEMREITILVSDLRGFTSLAARLSPDQVIDILNRYLEGMVDVIAKYRGTVDEFQGDGILAFFGAPLAAKDDQERAVACAIEMQNALVEINAEQHRRQLPELKMGIGINTGAVIIGNIGSEKRTKYGAVGSAINEAYRIESYTVGGQLLISPSVYDPLRHLVQIRSTQEVQFKGLSEAVPLYDVARLQGQYACALPEKAPETFVTLATPLPVACFLVEGKTVSDVAILGTIRRLSESAAEASLEGSVAVYSNVKLCLTPSQEAELPEVYAKVLALTPDAAPASSTQACLEFTSLPETAKTFLEHQRATALQDKPAQAS
ncbi:MAG: adenylate/guanylate cyclase domain-containing protein [Candidatus Tectomicrobia bacterium]